MTTTAQTTKPSRTQVWAILAPLLADPDGAVIGVRMHPDDITVEIQIAPHGQARVDEVLTFLGLPPGRLNPRIYCAGEPYAFRQFGRSCDIEPVPSPVLPGWSVGVVCDVPLAEVMVQ